MLSPQRAPTRANKLERRAALMLGNRQPVDILVAGPIRRRLRAVLRLFAAAFSVQPGACSRRSSALRGGNNDEACAPPEGGLACVVAVLAPSQADRDRRPRPAWLAALIFAKLVKDGGRQSPVNQPHGWHHADLWSA